MTESSGLDPLFGKFKPSSRLVPCSLVRSGSFRLTAGSFDSSHSVYDAFSFDGGSNSHKLSEIAQVFGFGPFSRTYITRLDLGMPLLSSADILEVDPAVKAMSKADGRTWSQYQVRRGWILISCSGTIGNVALIPRKWDGWAVSQCWKVTVFKCPG